MSTYGGAISTTCPSCSRRSTQSLPARSSASIGVSTNCLLLRVCHERSLSSISRKLWDKRSRWIAPSRGVMAQRSSASIASMIVHGSHWRASTKGILRTMPLHTEGIMGHITVSSTTRQRITYYGSGHSFTNSSRARSKRKLSSSAYARSPVDFIHARSPRYLPE